MADSSMGISHGEQLSFSFSWLSTTCRVSWEFVMLLLRIQQGMAVCVPRSTSYCNCMMISGTAEKPFQGGPAMRVCADCGVLKKNLER
jgi:hypothetical protein